MIIKTAFSIRKDHGETYSKQELSNLAKALSNLMEGRSIVIHDETDSDAEQLTFIVESE